jgi:hypothetical protein
VDWDLGQVVWKEQASQAALLKVLEVVKVVEELVDDRVQGLVQGLVVSVLSHDVSKMIHASGSQDLYPNCPLLPEHPRRRYRRLWHSRFQLVCVSDPR